MSKIKFSESKDLRTIDVDNIKDELMHSHSWDDIKEIYRFCFDLLNSAAQLDNNKTFTLDEIRAKLEELEK